VAVAAEAEITMFEFGRPQEKQGYKSKKVKFSDSERKRFLYVT